ncbi:MAG: Photosystem II 12 kDa extrinsic protein [Catillopecten margaritatus gill symbiont]|uniref:Photosystem II 12 kDa extrinsic protein n=1 Tax=Catillopecten margaritatus gill symbiont TaxID=3083288 RepID=A0AAU6PIB5_9GAMM
MPNVGGLLLTELLKKDMMKYFLRTIQTVVTMIMLGGSHQSLAKEFQTFPHANLVQVNDGDSFYVNTGQEDIHIRLYFVDCPETKMGSTSDAQRVREQMRYFGLVDVKEMVWFGNEAREFIKKELSSEFTVHTVFAGAMGRSKKRRVYGIIETKNGDDLGSLLVKNGLCRPHGVGRKLPNGVSRDEMFEKLRDLKDEAMLRRVGVWAKSDPNKIAEFRETQRNENAELKKLQNELNYKITVQNKLDLNTATSQQLESIKGIGPALAHKIINARPYKNIEDLLKVKGIGPKSIIKIRPYFFDSDE